MTQQVRKRLGRAENGTDVIERLPGTNEEAEALKASTDDLLDEIDRMLEEGELADATTYVAGNGE